MIDKHTRDISANVNFKYNDSVVIIVVEVVVVVVVVVGGSIQLLK